MMAVGFDKAPPRLKIGIFSARQILLARRRKFLPQGGRKMLARANEMFPILYGTHAACTYNKVFVSYRAGRARMCCSEKTT